MIVLEKVKVTPENLRKFVGKNGKEYVTLEVTLEDNRAFNVFLPEVPRLDEEFLVSGELYINERGYYALKYQKTLKLDSRPIEDQAREALASFLDREQPLPF